MLKCIFKKTQGGGVSMLTWVLGTGAPGGLGPSLASWAQGGMQGDEGWQLAEAAGTCS